MWSTCFTQVCHQHAVIIKPRGVGKLDRVDPVIGDSSYTYWYCKYSIFGCMDNIMTVSFEPIMEFMIVLDLESTYHLYHSQF